MKFKPLRAVKGLAAVAILLTSVFSCKKDANVKNSLPKPVVTAQAPTDSNFISFNVAVNAAHQIGYSHMVNGILTKKDPNALGLPTNKQILDTLAVPDNINPSYYIFNYVGGGYVVVPADKRVNPIMAFSDNGYFPHEGKLPAGLYNWLNLNHKNMQQLRKNTTLKTPAAVARLWGEILPNGTSGNKTLDKALPPPPPCQDSWSVQTVGPLLTTTWGQGQPYNYLVPAGNYDGGHDPTGCVATAMAQIMYYWKFPASYAWSTMPTSYNANGISYPGNQAVSQMMLDVGHSVGMSYAPGGSAPGSSGFPFYSSTSCSTALKNTFHYGSSTEASYDYAKVQSNLDSHWPVLLSASTDNPGILFIHWYSDGHEWVCDGYQQVTFTGCPGEPVLGETTLMYDMNWGWDGQGDGFFDFNQWIVTVGSTTYNWQYNQNMSYNIHP